MVPAEISADITKKTVNEFVKVSKDAAETYESKVDVQRAEFMQLRK